MCERANTANIMLSACFWLLIVLLDDVCSSVEIDFSEGIDEISIGQVTLLPPEEDLVPIPTPDWVGPVVLNVVKFH